MKTKKVDAIIYICAYFGSKLRVINELTVLIPRNSRTLWEVCGGLGSFILNRYWWFEIANYNEFNKKIYNILSVLKEIETRDRFINEVVKLPMSKDLFDYAKTLYNNEFLNITDTVDQAKYTFMLIDQSMNCEKKNWVRKVWNKNREVIITKRLRKVALALENINIMNRDCFEIIKENRHNNSDFILADVPYPEDSERVSKDSYDNKTFDWPLEKHKEFVDMVKPINGKDGCRILICTYKSPTYDILVNETNYWSRLKIKDLPSPANRKTKKRKRKLEYVYINYNNYSERAKYFVINESNDKN